MRRITSLYSTEKTVELDFIGGTKPFYNPKSCNADRRVGKVLHLLLKRVWKYMVWVVLAYGIAKRDHKAETKVAILFDKNLD
jgi:hypothetical protein